MNNLTIFESPEFGSIRTVEEDGKVLFCAKDVAAALGYKNTRDAINRHCKGVVKRDGVSRTTNQHGVTTEQTVEMAFIPEGDVYRLAAKSELPGAERFESWIFDEVIPSIRRTGGYIVGQKELTPAELMAKALLVAQKTLGERQAHIAELEAENTANKPKVIFADAVSASERSILVGELAKLLRQNGVEIGQNRLFDWMRKNGFLIRRQGTDYNMPTQKAMEMGLFEIKETSVVHSAGNVTINKTPKVTGKGQVYFINRFLDRNNHESENTRNPIQSLQEDVC